MTAEETTRLGDELDRLDGAVDDVVATLADADAGSASAQVLQQRANELDTQGQAVAALVDEHGPDATVTVRGLSAGEYARVEDRVAAMRSQTDQPGGLPGSSRNVFAAMGLVDAPFFDAQAADSNTDPLDAAISAVADQPIGVAKWLEARVNDLTTVSEGNWTPWQERTADTSGG